MVDSDSIVKRFSRYSRAPKKAIEAKNAIDKSQSTSDSPVPPPGATAIARATSATIAKLRRPRSRATSALAVGPAGAGPAGAATGAGPAVAPGLPRRLTVPLARGVDLLQRVRARVPAVDLHLLLLEVLVDREEVRDLLAELLREVVELLVRVPARILDRDAEHLVVDALVVLHAEQSDRLDVDHAAGERRLRHADDRVERVAVQAERLRDEPVVHRIDHRREQEAVELDHVFVVVELVLVAAPLWDLDQELERLVAHESELTGAALR